MEILNSKIMYVSRLKYMSKICMHACMFVDKHECFYVFIRHALLSMYICMHTYRYECMHKHP